jgi:hypothetical protein
MHTRLYLDPEQKRQLAERARLHGKTFSEEVSCAVNFSMALGIYAEDELTDMARAANLSADRIVRKLDETNTYVRRAMARIDRAARSSRSFPRN